MKFFGGVGRGPRNNQLDFGSDPDPLALFYPKFFTPNAFPVG